MGCNGLLSWSKPSWICKRLLCPESRYKYTLALELQLQIGWRQPSLLKAMQRILLIFVSQFPSSIFSRLLRVDGGRLCGGYPDCSVDSSHLVSITDIIGIPPARCLHREPVVSVCVIVFLYVYVFVCICSVDSHLLSIRDIIGTPPARCLHCESYKYLFVSAGIKKLLEAGFG